MNLAKALGMAGATVLACTAVPALAQTSSSYTFSGVVGGKASNLFTGTFTLANNAGVYSLSAFSGRYKTAVFDLSNSGLIQFAPSYLIIGGQPNGYNNLITGTDDFQMTFNPRRETGNLGIDFVSVANSFDFGPVEYTFRQATAGAVPEPASWGLMIVGFGLIGVAARLRRIPMTTSASPA